mmetsp:Transcript_9055/g.17265  ORF Transcript_9055/g.17265 Transcript_9055/m.17265 type:complete len:212 (-) Transcript_9055:74-709(-)
MRERIALLIASPSSKQEEEAILTLVNTCLLLAVFQQLFDFWKEIFNGAVRGSGFQSLGMVTSFVAYVLVCIPVSYCLAFQTLQSWSPGVVGLYWGTLVASVTHTILNCALIFSTDWDKAADMLQKENSDGDSVVISSRTLLAKQPSLGVVGVVSSSVPVPFSALMPSLRQLTRRRSFPGLEPARTRLGVPVPMRRQASAPGPRRPLQQTSL